MAYKYGGTKFDAGTPIVRDSSTPGPKPLQFDPTRCGSRAGYKQHKRHGNEICQPCQDANNTYMAAYNMQRRNRRVLKPCGTRAAYSRHISAGEKPCVECAEANAAYQRSLRRPVFGLPAVKSPLDRSACGTYSGYKRHIRRKLKPCRPCAAAGSEYYSDWKAAQQERRAA